MFRNGRTGNGSRRPIASLVALAGVVAAALSLSGGEPHDATAHADAAPSDTERAGSTVTSRDDIRDEESRAEPEVDIAHVRRVLGAYTTPRNLHRKYVLIDAGLSDDRLVETARRLHRIEPDTWYYLMDDDSRFDEMLAALPKTARGDYADWPAEYVEAHFVARVMQVIQGDGEGEVTRSWWVEGGPDRERLASEIR